MPYADAHAYLGNKVGRFHRRTWWYAKGKPRDEFEAVISEIRLQVEAAIEESYAFVHFQLFMIGRDEASAKPTIMFFCEEKKLRKKAQEALGNGTVMKKLPGFRTGHASTQPDIGSLVQCATGDAATETNSVLKIHEEVYYDPSSEVRAGGMPIYVKHQSGLQRQATAYAVFQGDRCMMMTVAHVFIERGSTGSDITADAGSDYDFGSDTESEKEDQEEITSRGSMSSRGRGSSEDLSTQTSQRSYFLNPAHPADPIENQSGPQRGLVSFTSETQSNSIEDSDERDFGMIKDLNRFGTVVRSSVDEDWALIDITDATISSTILNQTSSRTQMDSTCPMHGLRFVASVHRAVTIHGTLSENTSYVRFPGASEFQKLYVLHLRQNICCGDSGAIVMARFYRKLCGHVVASSSQGRVAFVIPADRIFQSSDTAWTRTLHSTGQYNLASLASYQTSPASESNHVPANLTNIASDYGGNNFTMSISDFTPILTSHQPHVVSGYNHVPDNEFLSPLNYRESRRPEPQYHAHQIWNSGSDLMDGSLDFQSSSEVPISAYSPWEDYEPDRFLMSDQPNETGIWSDSEPEQYSPDLDFGNTNMPVVSGTLENNETRDRSHGRRGARSSSRRSLSNTSVVAFSDHRSESDLDQTYSWDQPYSLDQPYYLDQPYPWDQSRSPASNFMDIQVQTPDLQPVAHRNDHSQQHLPSGNGPWMQNTRSNFPSLSSGVQDQYDAVGFPVLNHYYSRPEHYVSIHDNYGPAPVQEAHRSDGTYVMVDHGRTDNNARESSFARTMIHEELPPDHTHAESSVDAITHFRRRRRHFPRRH